MLIGSQLARSLAPSKAMLLHASASFLSLLKSLSALSALNFVELKERNSRLEQSDARDFSLSPPNGGGAAGYIGDTFCHHHHHTCNSHGL